MIDIDKLTIGEAKALAGLLGLTMGGGGNGRSHSIKTGEKYIIRTVTAYFTGRVSAVTDSDIVLDDAAWIADTGRWSDALKTGKLKEVEPYPAGVIVGRDGVVDIAPWDHELPRAVK